MTDDNQEKAEQLLQESKQQHRHTTDPKTSDGDDTGPSLQDAIRDAYTALDAGETHENLTIRDTDLAALMHGLNDADELEGIGHEANQRLNREADDTNTRAGILKALIRVGLNEVDPEAVETAIEAKREFLSSKADEF